MTHEIVGYEGSEEFQALADEIKSIMTEAVFNSRWELIVGYHAIGKAIVTNSNYKKWEQGKAGRVLNDLSNLAGISERRLYSAISFYQKYPNASTLASTLPEGKVISWNKIVTELLPAPSDQPEPPQLEKSRCPVCGSMIRGQNANR